MGFKRGTYVPNVSVAVSLPTRPGDEYVFTFPKQLPQAALDAEGVLISCAADVGADASRRALIELVAKMLLSDPTGFDDYPTTESNVELRALAYFDNPDEPEMETILVKAWGTYKELMRPVAFLKSLQGRGAAASDLPGAAGEA